MPDYTQSLPLFDRHDGRPGGFGDRHIGDRFDSERMNLIIRLIEGQLSDIRNQTAAAGAGGDYAPLEHDHAAADITDLVSYLNANLSLDDLSNVSAAAATSGQVLAYNGTAWVPQTFTAGTLAGLSDVQFSALADLDIIVYSAAATKWVNLSSSSALLPFLPKAGGIMTGDIVMTDAISIVLGTAANATLQFTGTEIAFNSAAVPIELSIGGTVALSVADEYLAVNRALNLLPAAGDIAAPVDGDMWYDSTAEVFRGRQDGVSYDLIGHIFDGSVETASLADYAVTPSKMRGQWGYNEYPDYDMWDEDFYASPDGGTISFSTISAATLSTRRLQLLGVGAGTVTVETDWFTIRPSTTYRIEANASMSSETGPDITTEVYFEEGTVDGSGVVTASTQTLVVSSVIQTTALTSINLTPGASARRGRFIMKRIDAGGSSVLTARFAGLKVIRRWTLDEIVGVDLTGLADGDTLLWDDATDTWIPGAGGGGGGGGNNYFPGGWT